MNNVGFDTRHCWAVRGHHQDGRSWFIRFIPGRRNGITGPLIRTLDESKSLAIQNAKRMIDRGGSVVAVKQHLDINELWQDS